MNRQKGGVTFAAAVGAALILTADPASAAKPTKPGGGTSDACAGARDRGFPSFAFVKPVTNGWGFFVTDAEALCQKQVGLYPYSRSLDFRYDKDSGRGVLIHDGNGYGLLAATMTVSFNSDGSPNVLTGSFQSLLAISDIPAPDPDTGPMKYVGSASTSPDGTGILFVGLGSVEGSDSLQWTCPLDIAAPVPSVDALGCRVVDRFPSGAGVSGSWGARGGEIYVIHPASSGSGDAVYRINLGTGQREEIYGRGTMFTVAKSALSASGVERLVIHEAPPYSSNCATMANLVIDADSCFENACNVLNGAGHLGAAALTWLPDGRVAQQGISISRGGTRCSVSGKIEAFDPIDTSGSRTTLTTGDYPDGAR